MKKTKKTPVAKPYRVTFTRHQLCELIVHATDEDDLQTRVKGYQNRAEVKSTNLDVRDHWYVEEIATPSFNAKQIMEAFNAHRNQLIVSTSQDCCNPGVTRHSVANDGVLLRNMLLSLGFTDQDIDQARGI